jgi:hypothetical protein
VDGALQRTFTSLLGLLGVLRPTSSTSWFVERSFW